MQRTTGLLLFAAVLASNAVTAWAQQPNAMLFWRLPLGGVSAEQEQSQFGFTLGYSRPQATLGPPPAAVRPPSLEFNFKREGFDGLRVGGYNTNRLLGIKPQTPAVAPSLRVEERVLSSEYSPGTWRAAEPTLPPAGIGLRPSPRGAEALAPEVALPAESEEVLP